MRIADLLRRYRTLLFLIALSVTTAVAALQTVRLHYLEQRHVLLTSDFGRNLFDLQTRLGEAAAKAARCAPAGDDKGGP